MPARATVRTGRAAAALLALFLVLVTAVGAAPARADWGQVGDLFARGVWDQARALAGSDQPGQRPAEAELWRSRLAAEPAAALEELRAGLERRRLPKPVRARLVLEAAELELGRGHPDLALEALAPLLDEGGGDVPGAVPVAAARALLALGRGPRARELLAGVRQTDPAYGLSRALLGDVALSLGDATQALHWYDAADDVEPTLRARTVSGRCRALLRAGRAADVTVIADRLEGQDPGSLALLEIRRALREHVEQGGLAPAPASRTRTGGAPAPGTVSDDDEAPAADPDRTAPAAAPPVAAAPDASNTSQDGDRYTLQLGAFTDRARALELQQRWADRVDLLTIVEGPDARGQTVYRLRAGAWADRDQADAAARELGQRLGLDVIVVDRQAADARAGGR
jgi:cell division septation protein DedD